MKTKKLKIGIGILLLLIAFYMLARMSGIEEEKNVYQKIVAGEEINILIVGDSIGAPSNEEAWSTLLKKYLETEYGTTVDINNVSMGGNTSYSGFFRVMMLNDKENYDLAIICYGQNDDENEFSMHYENIYKAIQEKYVGCSMISILESSQREYTYKMKTIMELASYYGVPIVDTISAFNNSAITYELLTEDGIHPNAEGHKLYFEAIREVMEEQMNSYESSRKRVNDEIRKFDDTHIFKVDEFRRINDCTYEIKMKSGQGSIGIFYDYVPGENKIKIYSNNQLLEKVEFEWSAGFQQEHIDLLENKYEIGNEIKIVFTNEIQADSFQGLSISYIEDEKEER